MSHVEMKNKLAAKIVKIIYIFLKKIVISLAITIFFYFLFYVIKILEIDIFTILCGPLLLTVFLSIAGHVMSKYLKKENIFNEFSYIGRTFLLIFPHLYTFFAFSSFFYFTIKWCDLNTDFLDCEKLIAKPAFWIFFGHILFLLCRANKIREKILILQKIHAGSSELQKS